MLDRLEQFFGLLRKNQVRVSVSEATDAVRAVLAVGLDRPDDLRAALAATLVKKPGDLNAFHDLFALFFLRGGDLARGLEGAPLTETLAELGLSDADIARVLELLAEHADQLSAVARAGLGMSNPDVVSLLRAAGVAFDGSRVVSPLHIGYHTHRLLGALGVSESEKQLELMLRQFRDALGGALADALAAAIAARFSQLRSAIRQHVHDEFHKQNRDLLDDLRLRTLAEKPFAQLGEDEIRRLRAEVVRLARKLRTQASLRRKVRKRGRLDVRATLRRSFATGGLPFRLRLRHRRKDRPRLVILCDVSDSVKHVARFMLELVYMLQDQFDRVRSFVFVSDLGEVTGLFASYEIERAVDLAYGGAVISVQSNSNYGRALEIFATRHLDAVTSRTTVLVIGDARNNYNPPNAERLSEIRQRAKRVLWMNPERPGAWGFGDSAMRDYEPHCDRVVVAYNLESLRKVVDDLIL